MCVYVCVFGESLALEIIAIYAQASTMKPSS